ncbi:MAG: GNAT family N-acetyltransferase [Pseudomonadales bacterium]
MTDLEWRLTRGTQHDVIRLHQLFCTPAVYRYLADGYPPPRSATEAWIQRGIDDQQRGDLGLWLLQNKPTGLAGCVRTHLLDAPETAELTYVLHPDWWGRGLATSMGWTATCHAFAGGRIVQMIAGTDEPNTASAAVMRRLGMRYLRATQNPRWPGVEYVRQRDDPPPDPLPSLLPIS